MSSGIPNGIRILRMPRRLYPIFKRVFHRWILSATFHGSVARVTVSQRTPHA